MHKIAFHLGPFTVHWYGVLVAIGFLAGFWTAGRRAPRNGIKPETVLDLGFWLMIGAIVGARTLHVVSYWKEEFAGKPFTEIFMIQNGGLVFYGGLIGASAATVLYASWKKVPLWKFADALIPSLPLGHFFGRLGCLMSGCCFGKSCDLPWAVQFPTGHETEGQKVHPVQVYEAMLNLLLYVVLELLYKRKKFDGQVFAVYLIGYSLLRGIVEIFRADYRPGEYFGVLTPGQVISIFLFGIGLALLVVLPRIQRSTVPSKTGP